MKPSRMRYPLAWEISAILLLKLVVIVLLKIYFFSPVVTPQGEEVLFVKPQSATVKESL